MKFFALSIMLLSVSAGATTTLRDVFELAKKNMENIKRAEAVKTGAEERKIRARALILPTVAGVGNETRIDQPDIAGNVNRAFILTRQYSAGIRLNQPLFRGGSLAGLDLAKDEILLTEFQKNSTQVNLYQLVINAYYNLYIARLDLKNLEYFLKLSEDRVKELRSRANVGRSRQGELVQAEAQYLTAQNQFQQGGVSLQSANENLFFLTGLKDIQIPDLGLIPRELSSISHYHERLKSRPDILANAQQVKMASRRVDVAKGGHYPQLDLVGNYYFDRTGVLATSEWDVAVVVSVPLYQGGGVQAAVREQVEAKRVTELDANQVVRASERDVSILYQNYLAIQSQLDTLKKATDKAKQGYDLNKKDYSYGQATNLDVIQSMNIYIEAKRSYDILLASAHMTYKSLEASVGVLP